MWITACSGKQLVCRQRWPFQRRHTNRQVTQLPCLQRTKNPCSRWRTPCQLKSNYECGTWYFVLKHATEIVHLSKKTTNILSHNKGCHEKDDACAFSKYKIPTTQMMPDMKTSLRALDNTDEIHGERKARNTPGHLLRCCKPHATFGKITFEQQQHVEPMCIKAIQDIREPEFNRISSRKIGHAQELNDIGLAKVRDSHPKKEGWYQAASQETKDDKQCTGQEVQRVQTFQTSPHQGLTRDLRQNSRRDGTHTAKNRKRQHRGKRRRARRLQRLSGKIACERKLCALQTRRRWTARIKGTLKRAKRRHRESLPARTKLEQRPQPLRCHVFGQKKSAAAVRQGQGPLPKGRYTRCQYLKHESEKEVQLHHSKKGLGTKCIAKVHDSKSRGQTKLRKRLSGRGVLCEALFEGAHSSLSAAQHGATQQDLHIAIVVRSPCWSPTSVGKLFMHLKPLRFASDLEQ